MVKFLYMAKCFNMVNDLNMVKCRNMVNGLNNGYGFNNGKWS